MKKSTLISTLAMVVIVALALTTATFAWYTSNSSVTATTNATAAVANASDLSIAKGTTAGSASTVDLTNEIQMLPLVPTAAAVKTESAAGTKAKDFGLWGSTIGVDTVTTGEDGKSTTTYTWTGNKYDGSNSNSFQEIVTITNQSKDETDTSEVSINMTVNWADVAVNLDNTTLKDTEKTDTVIASVKNALRIALFSGNGDNAELIALLAASTDNKVHNGNKEDKAETAEGANDAITASTVAQVAATSIATTTSATGIAKLKGQASAIFTIVMWFDGVALTQDLSGAAITGIVFTFGV